MLSGDFATFPVSDLLQWLDHSRKAGVLEIEGPLRQSFWIQLQDRTIVAASAPLVASPHKLVSWQPSVPAESMWPELCRDRILDLFFARSPGRFAFSEATADFEDGVRLELSVTESLMEALRRLDEWPRVERSYPDDGALLSRADPGPDATPVQKALLEAAEQGLSLAELRLALGLSRQALFFRLEELSARLRFAVGRRPDPLAGLTHQVEVLLKERQLDEAGHVLESLLAADVPEPRILELWREVEQEQVAALYSELSPLAIPKIKPDGKSSKPLTLIDQEVLTRVNGRLDVAGMTLVVPRREVETLRSVRRLVRAGLVELSTS